MFGYCCVTYCPLQQVATGLGDFGITYICMHACICIHILYVYEYVYICIYIDMDTHISQLTREAYRCPWSQTMGKYIATVSL